MAVLHLITQTAYFFNNHINNNDNDSENHQILVQLGQLKLCKTVFLHESANAECSKNIQIIQFNYIFNKEHKFNTKLLFHKHF